MSEGGKKKSLQQRVLEKAVGVHPDEGRMMRDHIPMGKIGTEVSQDYARQSITADYDRALEASIEADKYGRRTFPSALNVGGATPMYRGTQERANRIRRQHIAKMQPFYTDPGSGEVDYNQPMHPYVFASDSGMDRMDKATWPAYRLLDPIGELQEPGTGIKEQIREKVKKSAWLWDMLQKVVKK